MWVAAFYYLFASVCFVVCGLATAWLFELTLLKGIVAWTLATVLAVGIKAKV